MNVSGNVIEIDVYHFLSLFHAHFRFPCFLLFMPNYLCNKLLRIITFVTNS